MGDVLLTDPALDDLRRAGPTLAPGLLEHLRRLGADPAGGDRLVDPITGYHVTAVLDGAGRVVHDLEGDAVVVRLIWVGGRRGDGDAYAEALERMQAADPSEMVQLAQLLRRLARAVGVRVVPRARRREPVPDWLADALLERGAVDRVDLVAMDARGAFAAFAAAT